VAVGSKAKQSSPGWVMVAFGSATKVTCHQQLLVIIFVEWQNL
jgi:hypothetical protein